MIFDDHGDDGSCMCASDAKSLPGDHDDTVRGDAPDAKSLPGDHDDTVRGDAPVNALGA
ncbi:hypothetical protein [Rhodococcus sp. 15-725-2-2b]|uniref:hypothetical protein n=1 Tax=Rhodococcus sp. 15-725-2-2b TaxID=2023139 RepID=UPI002678D364